MNDQNKNGAYCNYKQHDIRKQDDDDLFDLLEEQCISGHENQGFLDGIERGKEDSQIEGQQLGEQEGARRGSELGYFHGYAMTYKQLLFPDKHGDNVLNDKRMISREERSLLDLLKLIEDYPRSNETNCEEKLQTIRVKFRQAFGRLGLDVQPERQTREYACGNI